VSSLGLGIDCGGTYTDAVVYDLDARNVLAAAMTAAATKPRGWTRRR